MKPRVICAVTIMLLVCALRPVRAAPVVIDDFDTGTAALACVAPQCVVDAAIQTGGMLFGERSLALTIGIAPPSSGLARVADGLLHGEWEGADGAVQDSFPPIPPAAVPVDLTSQGTNDRIRVRYRSSAAMAVQMNFFASPNFQSSFQSFTLAATGDAFRVQDFLFADFDPNGSPLQAVLPAVERMEVRLRREFGADTRAPFSFDVDYIVAVPEPGTILSMMLGLGAVAVCRWRRSGGALLPRARTGFLRHDRARHSSHVAGAASTSLS